MGTEVKNAQIIRNAALADWAMTHPEVTAIEVIQDADRNQCTSLFSLPGGYIITENGKAFDGYLYYFDFEADARSAFSAQRQLFISNWSDKLCKALNRVFNFNDKYIIDYTQIFLNDEQNSTITIKAAYGAIGIYWENGDYANFESYPLSDKGIERVVEYLKRIKEGEENED